MDILINFIIILPKYRKYGRIYEYIIIVINRLFKKKKFCALNLLKINVII